MFKESTPNKRLAETDVAPVSKRRGRPPLSAEQKQANKEAREQQIIIFR